MRPVPRYVEYRKSELLDACEENGLSLYGAMTDLVRRLCDYEEETRTRKYERRKKRGIVDEQDAARLRQESRELSIAMKDLADQRHIVETTYLKRREKRSAMDRESTLAEASDFLKNETRSIDKRLQEAKERERREDRDKVATGRVTKKKGTARASKPKALLPAVTSTAIPGNAGVRKAKSSSGASSGSSTTMTLASTASATVSPVLESRSLSRSSSGSSTTLFLASTASASSSQPLKATSAKTWPTKTGKADTPKAKPSTGTSRSSSTTKNLVSIASATASPIPKATPAKTLASKTVAASKNTVTHKPKPKPLTGTSSSSSTTKTSVSITSSPPERASATTAASKAAAASKKTVTPKSNPSSGVWSASSTTKTSVSTASLLPKSSSATTLAAKAVVASKSTVTKRPAGTLAKNALNIRMYEPKKVARKW